jgi:hypothetical protein
MTAIDRDRSEEILEELKAEPVDEKLSTVHKIKLATTCNKNGQQQGGKNNAEYNLHIKTNTCTYVKRVYHMVFITDTFRPPSRSSSV